MSTSHVTRSLTRSLATATQSSMLESSSVPKPSSPSSLTEVCLLFDCPTPPLTPSPPLIEMDSSDGHNTPPHQQPNPNLSLPQTMTTLTQAMMALLAQLQATQATQALAGQ